MPDFLQDSSFQFIVTVVLAVVAIVVAVVIALFQRKLKSFSYEEVSVAEIVSVKSEFRQSVQVLFEGKLVEDAKMIVVRFFNSGNETIGVGDFHDKVGICFSGGSTILSASVQSAAPDSLRVELIGDKQSLYLKPTLFNAGDSVTVNLIVKDYVNYSIVGRIVGVKEVSRVMSGSPKVKSLVFFLSGTFLGIFTNVLGSLFYGDYTWMDRVFVALVILVGFLVMVLLSVFYSRRP